jgi:hypothetical protein
MASRNRSACTLVLRAITVEKAFAAVVVVALAYFGARLDARLEAQSSAISNQSSAISDIRARLDAQSSAISNQSSAISDIRARLDAQSSAISDIRVEISDIRVEISDIRVEVSALRTSVTHDVGRRAAIEAAANIDLSPIQCAGAFVFQRDVVVTAKQCKVAVGATLNVTTAAARGSSTSAAAKVRAVYDVEDRDISFFHVDVSCIACVPLANLAERVRARAHLCAVSTCADAGRAYALACVACRWTWAPILWASRYNTGSGRAWRASCTAV